MTKSRGPITDPCGIPLMTFCQSENELFTLTRWLLWASTAATQSRMFPLIPQRWTFSISRHGLRHRAAPLPPVCQTSNTRFYLIPGPTSFWATVLSASPWPPVSSLQSHRCLEADSSSLHVACNCASGRSRADVIALCTFFSVCSQVSPSTSVTPSNRRLQCLDRLFHFLYRVFKIEHLFWQVVNDFFECFTFSSSTWVCVYSRLIRSSVSVVVVSRMKQSTLCLSRRPRFANTPGTRFVALL